MVEKTVRLKSAIETANIFCQNVGVKIPSVQHSGFFSSKRMTINRALHFHEFFKGF